MKIQAMAGHELFELTVERDDGRFVVEVGDTKHVVDVKKLEGDFYSILAEHRSYEVSVARDGDSYTVRRGAAAVKVVLTDAGRRARAAGKVAEGPETVSTAMPGRVVRILVREGDTVEAGQGVVVVEAMKMENEIACAKAGKVVSIPVSEGQSVEGGAGLVVVE